MSLITFTSSYGSSGEKIAQKVSEQLGIEFYDDRKFQERALSMGIPSKEFEGIDEKAPGFFDRLFTNKPAVYLDLLGSVVYDIASTGEGVIAGHGAQVFLEDFNCALHVMLYASQEKRSEWLAQDKSMNKDAAMQLIRRMDKRQKEFIQYAFDRDWKNPSGYDLAINLEKVGADWATRLILELAGSDEIKSCSLKAMEKMEFSSIQRKVKAAIIKSNIPTSFAGINVEVTGKGTVHLTGWLDNENDLDKVIGAVKDVPGVTSVTSDIVAMPSQYY